MRHEFTFRVVVECPDDHAKRFDVTRETLAPELQFTIQESLDDWTSNAADETLDDAGRIELSVDVTDITPEVPA